MKKIRVLIVDTNREYYIQLKNDLEENRDIQVVAFCNDGKEAIVKIYSAKPDIVLMDNILNTWDGIEVLDYLKYKNKTNLSIIFLSSIYNDRIKDMLISRGAKYVLGKLYNKQELINIIRQYYEENQINYSKELIQNDDVKLLDYIQKILIELGFKANLKGYRYLKEVMLLKFNNGKIKANKAFKEVARKYNTTEASVERAIRHSIQNTFNKNKEVFWYNLSYNKEVCPRNEEFLNLIYEELIMYYKI